MAWLVHAGEGDENTSLLTTERDSVQGEIGALRVIDHQQVPRTHHVHTTANRSHINNTNTKSLTHIGSE